MTQPCCFGFQESKVWASQAFMLWLPLNCSNIKLTMNGTSIFENNFVTTKKSSAFAVLLSCWCYCTGRRYLGSFVQHYALYLPESFVFTLAEMCTYQRWISMCTTCSMKSRARNKELSHIFKVQSHRVHSKPRCLLKSKVGSP